MSDCDDVNEYVNKCPRAGGFIYVLTNEAHVHLQKIGFTTRSPGERAMELGTTGSPYPFVVAFALYHGNPQEAERQLHEVLAPYRVRNEREFFCISLEDVVPIIVREFGEESDCFDPNRLRMTPEIRAKLMDTLKEDASSVALREQKSAAAEALQSAIVERDRRVERRRDVVREIGLYQVSYTSEIRYATLKSELETLNGDIAYLGTQIEMLRVNHREAHEAWRAAGGPERDEEMEKARRRLYGR